MILNRQWPVVDALFVLAAAGIALANLTIDSAPAGARGVDAISLALVVAMVAPLLVRRRWPVVVLIVSSGAWLAFGALNYPVIFPLAPLVAIYTIGEAGFGAVLRQRLMVVLGLSAVLAVFVVLAFAADRPIGAEPEWILGLAALGAAAWLIGDRLRSRAEAVQIERRAALAEDRARLARELHDSVGHAISAIGINAGAARLNLDRDSSAVTRALDDIEGACRRTVGEMDAVLGGLRGEVDLPGLAGLDDLISGHRRLGRQVDATIDYNGVDARTGRAAYRIVQEALTNALRHAPDDPVELTVVQTEDSLDIQVANATAVDMFREGRGLTGMKERAEDLGGSADAKAREGRFTLTARLPADAPS